MNFLRFLISKSFLKNLGIAFAMGVFILFFAFLWLRIYTKHGKTLTVPDLSGLSLEEVEIITNSKSLRFEVVDSIYNDDLPRGTVAKQNPKPGSKVKDNRRLYLTMNAFNPEKVTMPSVTGVSLRQARAILQTYGLNLGQITYKPDIAENVVLSQMINDTTDATPGIIVVKGSEIDLVLGRGLSNERTAVPNLTGFSLILAKEFLADRYLNVGAKIYDNSIMDAVDSSTSFIWKQRPAFEEGNEMRLGANVDVWLTIDSTKLPQPDSLELEEDMDVFDVFENE